MTEFGRFAGGPQKELWYGCLTWGTFPPKFSVPITVKVYIILHPYHVWWGLELHAWHGTMYRGPWVFSPIPYLVVIKEGTCKTKQTLTLLTGYCELCIYVAHWQHWLSIKTHAAVAQSNIVLKLVENLGLSKWQVILLSPWLSKSVYHVQSLLNLLIVSLSADCWNGCSCWLIHIVEVFIYIYNFYLPHSYSI